jgi:CBS domain containing-hemolysin-like protein
VSGWIGLALVALLIVANGLFVAAEFSLVSVRRPVIEDRAAAGDRRARLVARELGDLSFSLSSAQFGITVTSLLVGFLAERAIGTTIVEPVLELVGLPAELSLTVTVGAAFLLSTVTQMVLGELFPKNLAISRPLGVALAVTPLTRGFGILLGPIIRVFDRSARAVTTRIFRVEVTNELEGGHSLDELARIIAASGAEGSLTLEQTALLRRAVELGDRRVGEVMVPRPDVVWCSRDDSLRDVRARARRTGHSRFPIQGDGEDDVLGTVHVKDLLEVPATEHATTPVLRIAAPALAVPESEDLRRLLQELRRSQRTFAVVIDEYGGTAGIVTLEDVLEELVGEIEDEFDRAGRLVQRLGAGRHLVQGSLRADRLAPLVGEPLPEGEYETVAGFVLDRLGHIPAPGEQVEHGNVTLTVTRVEGVRITELMVATDQPPVPADPGAASGDDEVRR